MANICSNKVMVSGDSEDLEKFIFDFFRVKVDPNGGTYESFCLEAVYLDWEDIPDFSLAPRTKTDSDRVVVERLKKEESRATFWLDSPWGPPRDIFTRVSKDRPGLRFVINYDEPNLGELGTFIVSSGEVERDD